MGQWSAAGATLLVAWAAMATGLLATFALWQRSHVWQGVPERRR
jgi:hypothetical protein